MATREDVVVDFEPSPRIAIVDAPSVEFVVQDIVDTLRKREDTFRGMSETKLLDASGKQDLGGGTSVGITADLQDTQIAFEGRTDPAETGTVTTGSSAPIGDSPPRKEGLIELIDINADFLTANIQRGSLVINFDDQSVAEVYSVISPTTLITRKLSNGITNTFQIGDNYHVFNIIQCELVGGNLVGTDENGTKISPISPTAFTQIVRVAATSSTIIDPVVPPTATENAAAVWEYSTTNAVTSDSYGELGRRSAFNDYIYLDTTGGTAGTAWPLGTTTSPVNNMADAVAIGIANGIYEIRVADDATVLATDNINGFTIIGSRNDTSVITVDSGASTQFTTFSNTTLTGTLSGRVVIRDSIVDNLDGVQGVIHQTVIEDGGIQLAPTTTGSTYILDSFGSDGAFIDYAGVTAHDVDIRNFNGGLAITNKTDTSDLSIDFNSGELTLDNTTTTGDITLRGIYNLENNSTGSPGVNLIQNTNLDNIEIKVDNMQTDIDAIAIDITNMGAFVDDLIKYQRNKSVIDPILHTLTIFDDDGVTPLTVFDLKDENGVASCTSVFQRIPQLGSP